MFRFSRAIQEKYGIVGIVNYAAAVFLLAGYIVVELVRHGSIFDHWPSLTDLGLSLLVAIGFGLGTMTEYWLVARASKFDESDD
jgi:hypothetical protein